MTADKHTHARPSADPPGDPPLVWLCTYEHRRGVDAWVAASEAAAWASLARIARRDWAEALALDRRLAHDEALGPLPPEPPEANREAVERYFAVMAESGPGEHFSIEA